MTERRLPVMQLLDDCSWVVALVRSSGRCDVEDFIRSIDPRYRARYRRYFEYLRDNRPIRSPENFRTLQRVDGVTVVELKVDKYRLYLVHDEPYWYATHGRDKPKDHAVGAEIDRALNAYLTLIAKRG